MGKRSAKHTREAVIIDGHLLGTMPVGDYYATLKRANGNSVTENTLLRRYFVDNQNSISSETAVINRESYVRDKMERLEQNRICRKPILKRRSDAKSIIRSEFPGISLPPKLAHVKRLISDIFVCLKMKSPTYRGSNDRIFSFFVERYNSGSLIITDEVRVATKDRFYSWYQKPTPKKKPALPLRPRVGSAEYKAFYWSDEWRELRYRILVKYESKCMCCGRSVKDGAKLHVDHIKPRSKFPELELDENNLQVLCEDCNLGKSNKFDTDHR